MSNSPSRVIGDNRGALRPGQIGGDPGSPMARPTLGTALPGNNQRNQVIATGATAGSFTLRVQGRGNTLDVTTAAINFNDSAATLVAKLDAVLNPLGLDATVVSGGPLPAATVFEINGSETFTVTAGNQGSMVGGTAVVSTTQAAAGPVVSMTQTRPPRFTKSSAMARPSALGREPRS